MPECGKAAGADNCHVVASAMNSRAATYYAENYIHMSSLTTRSHTKLKVGDLVEVMTAGEILRTLDDNGSLDGLPFMPEMVEHCGRRARLSCRALKACVECLTDRRFIDIRGFGSQDVWVLEDLRCSGADHDGCQRGCLFFWKAAWLRKVEANQPHAKPLATDAEGLLRKLKTKTAPDRYFCQSTELVKRHSRYH